MTTVAAPQSWILNTCPQCDRKNEKAYLSVNNSKYPNASYCFKCEGIWTVTRSTMPPQEHE